MPNPGTASGTPDLNDLFYLELKYDVLQSGLTGTAAKNGNISQVIWRTRGRERQAYSLTYDYLDRLIAARYDNISDAGTVNNTSAWDENLVYDIRGNINTLTRTGKYKTTPSATCWTNGQIDALTYTYNTNTNKLQKIADAAPAASIANSWNNPAAAPGTAQYGYDANGNMIADPYKNLGITYNFLNLPQKMTFSLPSGAEQTIDILYDGTGRKLRKTVKDGGVLQYTQESERITGSLGCFGLAGKNSGIKAFISDVVKRRSQNSKKSKGDTIRIEVEKRSDTDWQFSVDKNGKK